VTGTSSEETGVGSGSRVAATAPIPAATATSASTTGSTQRCVHGGRGGCRVVA